MRSSTAIEEGDDDDPAPSVIHLVAVDRSIIEEADAVTDDKSSTPSDFRLRLVPDSVLEQIDVLSVSAFASDAQAAAWARQVLSTWNSVQHRTWPLFRGHLFEQVWHDRYNASHIRTRSWLPPKSTWKGYDAVTIKRGIKPIFVGKTEVPPATCPPHHVIIVEGQPLPAGVKAHSLKAYHPDSGLLARAQELAANKIGDGDNVVTTKGTRRSPNPKVVEDPSIGDGYLKKVAGNANGDHANPSVDDAVVAAQATDSLSRTLTRAATFAGLAAAGWQLVVELHQLDESPSLGDFEAAAKRIFGASATATAGAAVGVGAAWWFTQAGGAAFAADLLGLAADAAIPSWFAAAAASAAVFAVVLLPIEVWRFATHRSTLRESAVRLLTALGMFGLSVGALALGLPAWLPAVLLFGAVAVAYVIKHGPVEAARRIVDAGTKVAQGARRVRAAAAPAVEHAVDSATCKLRSATRWAKDHTAFVPVTPKAAGR